MRVIIVGGSIGGLSAAHALLAAGCDVTVLEKAPSVSAAGAGLGLDAATCSILCSWVGRDALDACSLAMPVEENRRVEHCGAQAIHRDEHQDRRSTHWSDIHQMLLRALPDEGIMLWSHRMLDFKQEGGRVQLVVAKGAGGEAQERLHLEADLMVAADGSMSQTRAKLRPGEQSRYSGYCAWRGVLRTSEDQRAAAAVKQEYKDFGRALYFDVAPGTHSVLYELPGERMNWLWYVNQPPPERRGSSVTVKADEKRIEEMHGEAERTWTPAMAALMKATPAPFINAIYDREPLDRLFWGRTVLIGEAAHPTTPHGLRSTNMAIQDAAQLGKSIAAHPGDVDMALQDFQAKRLAATTQEVLFSRWLGQAKQGMFGKPVWEDAAVMQLIGQRCMHDFDAGSVQWAS